MEGRILDVLYYSVLYCIIQNIKCYNVLYCIVLYYIIVYYIILFCTILSHIIMYSVLFSDGMVTCFTCATPLRSRKSGYPIHYSFFERGWQPPPLITGCGHPQLLRFLEHGWPPPTRVVLQCMILHYTILSGATMCFTVSYYIL